VITNDIVVNSLFVTSSSEGSTPSLKGVEIVKGNRFLMVIMWELSIEGKEYDSIGARKRKYKAY
jgi:hypothetical protein